MKVTRKVDTIIVEMDIITAEKVQSLLFKTHDTSLMFGDLTELAIGMARQGIDGTQYVAQVPCGGMVRLDDYFDTKGN